MRRLPDALEVIVTVGSQPVAGVMVRVGIAVTRKNSLSSIHGPSSAGGVIHVTRDAILRDIDRQVSLAPMDYGHPEEDAAGTLHVVPLDRHDLELAIQGYDRLVRHMNCAPGYRDALVQATQRLREFGSVRIDTQATVVGGEMQVESRFTRV